MELIDRVVLITGGRRIGHTVASRLARAGADVAVSFRGSREQADRTAVEVRDQGRRAAVIGADVAEPEQCVRLVEQVVGELGRLDVLINMASIYRAVPFDALTERDWHANIAVNAGSVFFCAQAAVPHMRRQGGGRIINFADWLAPSGRPAYTGYVAYYTAKAAVVALTEVLALELAPEHILVNAIAPGPIVAPPDLTAAEHAAVVAATPLGRWGGAVEIAKVVQALIETDFITGETIRVDGGRHLR
jgi:NAD(P)-dependent dehydrogenase (short-subunit alcohol dehydrogenase family)